MMVGGRGSRLICVRRLCLGEAFMCTTWFYAGRMKVLHSAQHRPTTCTGA